MNQDDIQQKIADYIDGAAECTRQFMEEGELNLQIDDLIEKTEITIQEYPIKSIVVGVIGGFIIGKLLN
jgi:ElaB/YqjD/DUF883 family membrane-anchored ribosome-binding protein